MPTKAFSDRQELLKFIRRAITESPELQQFLRTFSKDEVLFRQGDPIPHLYLLLEGEVILNHQREDGTELDLITLSPGHFIGLVAFTTGNHSLTTCRCTQNTIALCIRQDEYETIMTNHPKLSNPVQKLMLSNMADRFQKNVQLESKMNALNKQLEDEGEQLKEAYEQLESSHQKLVHQEKMATLGELVAGFAHEVNNPAAALLRSSEMLKSNFGEMHLNDAFSQIFKLGLESKPVSSTDIRTNMLQIQKQFPWVKERSQIRKLAQMPDEALALILKHKKKVGLDQMVQQFESGKFIHNIQVASERIANLVKSLKSYSRHDNNEWEEIDIREGINDTILILSNRLKYLNVELDLKEIPKTCGKMGELNQVWTNILVNACDVLPNGGDITIKTKAESDFKIVVEITDNGPGIPEKIIDRIFEPNFTTKNQGAEFGLGLGLAISNEIVRQHGGFIKVSNLESGGASFKIILPVRDC
ncbi:MAG: cyclic nucleotide-binding domain-containing protein [Balneolaceae bacterium]|nr:cyclic nucleotide-binding domain-containing protein [Balneolaceae bacterium]